MSTETRGRLRPGDQAPDFALPAVQGQDSISLSSYEGRPLLLALFRGIY
ncbi:MAG: hypothetical protein ACYDAG_18300 [Chloroflexota bacterium]